ncbi:MAG: hypothetical protein ABSB78_00755 [Bacteroidota bacterium]
MNLLKKVSVLLMLTLFFFPLNLNAQGEKPPAELKGIKGSLHILKLNDWTIGSNQLCSWDWGNVKGNVKLTLWKGNQLIATLSPSCPVGLDGKGSTRLLVPANLKPGEYELRIVSLSDPKIGDRHILKIIDKSTPGLASPGSPEYKELKLEGEHKVGNELKYEHKGEIKIEHKSELKGDFNKNVTPK